MKGGAFTTGAAAADVRVTLSFGDILGAGGSIGTTTEAAFVDGSVTVSTGGGGAGLALAVAVGTWVVVGFVGTWVVVVGVVVLVDGSTVTRLGSWKAPG